MWRISSTTCLLYFTILLTERPMPGRSGWNGRAFPLPGWPDGKAEGAAQDLAKSAARGRELAKLFDTDSPVPGVTEGTLRPEIAAIAVPATVDNRNMTGDDFELTANWGHYGSGEAVMPGQGRVEQRKIHG